MVYGLGSSLVSLSRLYSILSLGDFKQHMSQQLIWWRLGATLAQTVKAAVLNGLRGLTHSSRLLRNQPLALKAVWTYTAYLFHRTAKDASVFV